ncbi:MAG: methyltransferase domain-containing protein [Nitrososphaerota archaeon]|jgi:SAM-dependent methyltransferase|nr:methyltransferase domain-containing protein [Nitrososphaerota archaeon]MDG6953248.1 methyltransferase domain-containing protein [Nitrososphaerota archaeon]MDG6956629.1 methyltransferase domain-containing protein [Nitrososphaerota archaeon]MDG6957976.1 methyltransferase domain-containing protein [Nitrososphaerota archaeon]MDG6960455.1 methyltransferase domain-containing protein [Nitrososphaerota archaeon]
MTRSVRRFYSGNVEEEWARLQSDPYHRLEFDTTLEFLRRYLPKNGLILDAGGGPGRYAIELARKGYDVVLLDYAPANLRFAEGRVRREGLGSKVTAVEGSIVDLARFPDGYFDAVLCLGGPLSHVMKGEDRRKAMAELARVGKARSPIFVSVMSRLAMIATALKYFPDEVQLPLFKKIRDSGDYLGGRGFTATHFFLPEELRAEAEGVRGVEVLAMVGLEGVGSVHREEVNRLAKDPRRWRVWLETHYKTCAHPSVVGVSEHMLVVLRRRG